MASAPAPCAMRYRQTALLTAGVADPLQWGAAAFSRCSMAAQETHRSPGRRVAEIPERNQRAIRLGQSINGLQQLLSKLPVARVASRGFRAFRKRRVNRNGHQACSPRDPRAFRTHDRSQPAPERLGFAQVVPVKPRAQERRLGGIFGPSVVSQERIGVCGRGTVVSPDEFTERLSGLGVRPVRRTAWLEGLVEGARLESEGGNRQGATSKHLAAQSIQRFIVPKMRDDVTP